MAKNETKNENAKGLRISDKAADQVCNLITTMLDNCESKEWKTPWLCRRMGLAPMNISNSKGYRGFNDFMLSMAIATEGYKTPFFLTIDQMNKLGLNIKKHLLKTTDKDGNEVEKMVSEGFYPVFKWIARIIDADGNKITGEEYDALTDEEKDTCRKFFTLRVFCEYNLDQTTMEEDAPELYAKFLAVAQGAAQADVIQDVDAADATLDYILDHKGAWICPISFDGGNEAYYRPSTDSIHLPERKNFYHVSDLYSTALHEMAHSTKKVLKRDYGRKAWGDEGYATEELVAELTSAIVAHDLGIEKTIHEDHLVYVNGWKKAIKDKEILTTIIDDIMRCVSFELNHYAKVDAMLNPMAVAA